MLLEHHFEKLLHEKQFFSNRPKNTWFSGLRGSAFAFLADIIYTSEPKTLIIIASDKEKAAYLLNDIEALLPEKKVLFFPESHKQPYQAEKTTNANVQE